jgi:ankyrin repeat protein
MMALHYAAEHGHVDLITQLLDMHADVQATDEDVRAPPALF